MPSDIQYAFMWSKLSNISRLTAITRRSNRPGSLGRWAQPRVLGMNGQRDERLETVGLVLQLAEPQQVIDAMPASSRWPIEHRGVGTQPEAWAVRWTSSQVAGVGLAGAIWLRTSGSKISAPPPGRLPSPAAISCCEDRRDRLARPSRRTRRFPRP